MITGDEALTLMVTVCPAEASSTSFSVSSVSVSGLFAEDIESGLRPAAPILRDGIVSRGGGVGLLPLPLLILSACLYSTAIQCPINLSVISLGSIHRSIIYGHYYQLLLIIINSFQLFFLLFIDCYYHYLSINYSFSFIVTNYYQLLLFINYYD